MNIDTRTIKNFLSPAEVKIIDDYVTHFCDPWENWNPSSHGGQVLSGYYYVFDYYSEKFQLVKDILQPKFTKEFGEELVIQQIHIFDCFDPYKIHSDVDSGGEMLPHAPNPAWTFIVPLYDVDSHTIVFKEESPIKEPQYYIERTTAYEKPTITPDTWNKYFSHTPYEWFHWLTIEDIFKWEQGALFAASRYKFHTSDNFLANGVKNKKALIAWTSLPD